jgi:hypothetical protein
VLVEKHLRIIAVALERFSSTHCSQRPSTLFNSVDPARLAQTSPAAICPEDFKKYFQVLAKSNHPLGQRKMKSLKKQSAKLGIKLPQGMFGPKLGGPQLTLDQTATLKLSKHLPHPQTAIQSFKARMEFSQVENIMKL